MKSRRAPTSDLDTIMPILIGIWRRLHKLPGPPDKLQTREFRSVVAAVKALQEQSLDGQSLIGTDYFCNRDLLGAYLLYQWVIRYQEGLSLMGELPCTPKRVLDVCSGAAPFAFAALRHGARDVIAVDQNDSALQLGAEVCGRYGMPLAVRQWNCLRQPLPLDGTFDLIIVAHCLHELFHEGAAQQHFIEELMKRLSPHGFLMVVDNSYQEANQRVLQLRNRLVAKGVPIQAPCVWRGECPASKTPNSPCYAQRLLDKPYLIKEIQRAASINLSSLKMTYLIFRNPQSGWPDTDDMPLYRVISPPAETYHGKRYYLCGTDGKKQLESHLKEHPPESRACDYLRRGELIAFEQEKRQGHAINIVEGTKVRVVAPLGKALVNRDNCKIHFGGQV